MDTNDLILVILQLKYDIIIPILIMVTIESLVRWLRKTCTSLYPTKEETNCVKFYNTYVDF